MDIHTKKGFKNKTINQIHYINPVYKRPFPLLFLLAVLMFLNVIAFISHANSAAIEVYANTKWNNTGVYLNAGQTFSVSANGTAYYSSKEPGVSPEGSGGGPATSDYLLAGAERHCLIGKIGGRKFEVRSSYSGTAPASGTLYLGMNESQYRTDYNDNSGNWTANIRTQGTAGFQQDTLSSDQNPCRDARARIEIADVNSDIIQFHTYIEDREGNSLRLRNKVILEVYDLDGNVIEATSDILETHTSVGRTFREMENYNAVVRIVACGKTLASKTVFYRNGRVRIR